MKDAFISMAALPVLNNSPLKNYGKATAFRINTAEQTLDLELELKGESSPIQIQIRGFDVVRDGAETFVVLKEVNTSREWMTVLAQERLAGRRLRVPQEMAGALSFVL